METIFSPSKKLIKINNILEGRKKLNLPEATPTMTPINMLTRNEFSRRNLLFKIIVMESLKSEKKKNDK